MTSRAIPRKKQLLQHPAATTRYDRQGSAKGRSSSARLPMIRRAALRVRSAITGARDPRVLLIDEIDRAET